MTEKFVNNMPKDATKIGEVKILVKSISENFEIIKISFVRSERPNLHLNFEILSRLANFAPTE